MALTTSERLDVTREPCDRSHAAGGATPIAPARRALVAASLGWMLDAFDVMLYALVLPSLMEDLALDADDRRIVQSLTLRRRGGRRPRVRRDRGSLGPRRAR